MFTAVFDDHKSKVAATTCTVYSYNNRTMKYDKYPFLRNFSTDVKIQTGHE